MDSHDEPDIMKFQRFSVLLIYEVLLWQIHFFAVADLAAFRNFVVFLDACFILLREPVVGKIEERTNSW